MSEEKHFMDLCMILSEIVLRDHRRLYMKYLPVGYEALLGTIICEIKRRRDAGDKLRSQNKKLLNEIEELRQLNLFERT